jgi:hypothetical protein
MEFIKDKISLIFITILFICPGLTGFSQPLINTAFQSGESLRFKGSYFMSSLWADLAEVKTDVTDFNSGGKSLYTITATASTYSNYDSFFKIRDLFQTWIDKNEVKPYIFKRVVDEGGYRFNMKYIIQRNILQAKFEFIRNGRTRNSVIKITENTQDLVSVLYYVRTIDFEKMAVNKTVAIPTLIDDKVQDIILTFRGKETIKTEVFGSVSCYKIGISANTKGVVNKETNNIWLTANNNKIPVLVKAEIPVGSVQLRLIEANGIKK